MHPPGNLCAAFSFMTTREDSERGIECPGNVWSQGKGKQPILQGKNGGGGEKKPVNKHKNIYLTDMEVHP